MAKKKTAADESAEATMTAAPARARNEVPYTVGTWNGMDNYQCGLCDFKHLDFNALEKHAKTAHRGILGEETSQ